MDWTQILVAFITAGGFTAAFTISEKKTGMFLDNVKALVEEWKKIIAERDTEVRELKTDNEKKDNIIESLHKQNSEQSRELDNAHSETAIAKLMICDKFGCMKRRPPFGKSLDYDLHSPVVPNMDGCDECPSNHSEKENL